MLLQWSQSQTAQVFSSCFFTEVSYGTLRYSHHVSSLKSVTERSGILIMFLHWSQLQNARVLLSYSSYAILCGWLGSKQQLTNSHHASSMKSITERSGILIILLHRSQLQNTRVLSSCFFNEVSYGTRRYFHHGTSMKSVTERVVTFTIPPPEQ